MVFILGNKCESIVHILIFDEHKLKVCTMGFHLLPKMKATWLHLSELEHLFILEPPNLQHVHK